MVDLFRTSMKGSLKIGDMFKAELADESARLSEQLENHWDSEVFKTKNKGYKPSLMKALCRTFFWRYMFYGILQFLEFAVIRYFLNYK